MSESHRRWLPLFSLASMALLWPAAATADKPAPPAWHLGASAFHISGLDKWKNDLGFGARLGYWFSTRDFGIRHGPQLDFISAGFDDAQPEMIADLDLSLLFLSYQMEVFFLPTDPRWSLYFGGGAGVARGKWRAVGFESGSDENGAAQAFVGIEFAPVRNVGIRLGYRHLWIDNLSDGNTPPVKGESANLVEAGLTLRF